MPKTREFMFDMVKVCERTEAMGILPKASRMTRMMDLEYTNEVIPLDLKVLLAFDDTNFVHDVIGIYNNFNRQTLQMDNFFLPRCAASQHQKKEA